MATLFYVKLNNFLNTPLQPADIQSIPINSIFDVEAQGPYQLEAVLGDGVVVSISADNNQRKRIVIIQDKFLPIKKDIDTHAKLYVTKLDGEMILMETTYKNSMVRANMYNLYNSIIVFKVY